MRLNLGEVATGLGCGRGMVIWDGPGDALATPGKSCEWPTGHTSLKSLARKRSGLEKEPDPSSQTSEIIDWEKEAWASLVATGAKVDSREIEPGDLFFCLPGERTDGHDFALDAARAGASAIIALRNPFLNEAGEEAAAQGMVFPPVFLVEDVREALWRLAICHRGTSLARVVGITGTAGKTSVKEVLGQILEGRGRTERNPKNFNNQIGLPLSMLNASADASFWVMEAGISEADDMDELGRILRPDIALILNVGQGHIQGLGDRGVAAYKARLLDYIQPGGTAVISADYPELNAEVAARKKDLALRNIEVLRFSIISHDVFCRAEYEGPTYSASGQYWLSVQGTEYLLETPFRGEFGSENVAAIVAVATHLGLTLPEIRHGFARAELPHQRFSCTRYENFTLVDDSYNSNPLSAKRMIRAAQGMAWEYGLPFILVMGEMLELGVESQAAHEDLARTMAEAKVESVFWKGGQVAAVRRGLRQGQYQGDFYPVASADEMRSLLHEFDMQRGLVLFKGSRSNRMEELLEIFKEWMEEREAGRGNETEDEHVL
ncbi:UDP-N-acetylmuramoyl-tripeptide--D-alanyl-D-alanine ligase [Desulfovibrio sp. OttesenSCG-928-M14]|nr:UDP-N-acetylmuramoyl-tripeptide--D-alanyl-D-alanine ligase [Desulfovibrio sp. OttesenSCG-928-M14]